MKANLDRRWPRDILLLILLTFLCRFNSPMFAAEQQQQRPKIALVLGGGGARGGAHVGVLQALEEANIPIDMVVGTSYGALVGGLYAAGYSTAQITIFLEVIDWDRLLSNVPDREFLDISTKQRRDQRLFELELEKYNLKLPIGLNSGQRIRQLLDLLTVPILVEADNDFDRLPIPFRAVATDIVTGNQVVFRDGSLGLAIRSSIAVPAFFTPVPYGEALLVDGGVVNNVPVDVAREDGADIVIAVDVSTPLLSTKEQFASFGDVLSQAIGFKMAEKTDQNLKDADVVIRPDLGEFSAANFPESLSVVEIGHQAALAVMDDIVYLLRQGGEASERQQEQKPKIEKNFAGMPLIDPIGPFSLESIGYEGLNNYDDRYVGEYTFLETGETIDIADVDRQTALFFSSGIFQSIGYRIEPEDDKKHLIFDVQEMASGRIGLGLRYDRDFDFSARLHLDAENLFGIHWKGFAHLLIGSLRDLRFGLRSNPKSRYKISFDLSGANYKQERSSTEEGQGTRGFIDRRNILSVGGTTVFSAANQLELHYTLQHVNIKSTLAEEFSRVLAGLSAKYRFDTLDEYHFPTRGIFGQFAIEWQSESFGGDFDYVNLYAATERSRTFYDIHTITYGGRGGWLNPLRKSEIPVFERYFTGGGQYLQLASAKFYGLSRDQINSEFVAQLNFSYRLRLFRSPLNFLRRVFVAGHYNGGWFTDEPEKLQFGDILHGFGIGIAFDLAVVGPFRFDYGRTSDGDSSTFFLNRLYFLVF